MIRIGAFGFEGAANGLKHLIPGAMAHVVVDPLQGIGVNGYLYGLTLVFLIGAAVAQAGQIILKQCLAHFVLCHFSDTAAGLGILAAFYFDRHLLP